MPVQSQLVTHLEFRGAVAQVDQDPLVGLDGCVSGADRVNVLLVDRPDLVPLLKSAVPGGALEREDVEIMCRADGRKTTSAKLCCTLYSNIH